MARGLATSLGHSAPTDKIDRTNVPYIPCVPYVPDVPDVTLVLSPIANDGVNAMLKMIHPDQALDLVLAHAAPLPAETVPLDDAIGRVAAEPIAADRDYPPFHRAMMDGVAVHLSDAGQWVQLVGEVAAGGQWRAALAPGTAVEIMTGAPAPAGAEAVVPREDLTREGDRVRLPDELRGQQNIAPRASAVAAGQPIIQPGDPLSALAVGVLASVGRDAVRAVRRPRLRIISTGSELVDVAREPGAAQIRDSNAPMLAAFARALGLTGVATGRAADTPDALRDALDQARDAELLVLIGGVSAGRYDLVPQALAEAGVELIFHKVTQKPGKPLLFGRRQGQLVFGLPGNPLSCHFCFHRYVAPAARALAGRRASPPGGAARLTHPWRIKGSRIVFQLGRVEPGADGHELTLLRNADSADLFNTHRANCIARLKPAPGQWEPGARIDFEWLAGEV